MLKEVACKELVVCLRDQMSFVEYDEGEGGGGRDGSGVGDEIKLGREMRWDSVQVQNEGEEKDRTEARIRTPVLYGPEGSKSQVKRYERNVKASIPCGPHDGKCRPGLLWLEF